MRNFTLCAASLVLAAGAVASPLKPLKSANNVFHSMGETKVDARAMSAFRSADKTKLSMAEAVKKGGKKVAKGISTRAEELEELSTEIRYEQPEGTLSDWSKNCLGYMSWWGMIGYDEMRGIVQQIVEGEDDKLYLNVVLSQFPMGDVWVEADKKDDGGFSIPAGQCVYFEEYFGDLCYFYLTPMLLGDYNDEIDDFDYTYYDSLEFNLVDGEYVQANPEIMMALCENDETTGGEYYWAGYGDSDIVISPLTQKMAELPANFETDCEKWAALTDDGGYFVKVLVDGDTMYTKGLIYGIEDGVLVGKIKDDKVSFEAGQFVGMDYYWTWTYVYGGEVEAVYDEEWDMYDYYATITGGAEFNYDAENKKISTVHPIVVSNNYSENIEEVIPSGFIEELTIELQHRNPEALPQDPYDVEFYDEMEYYGSNTLYFNIPELDVDGNLLEVSNLYYRMYVDGDLFTFYADEYPGLPEEGETMINAEYSNFSNIYTSGINKCIWLYFEGMDEIGIQSVYLQPVEGGEPKELATKIVTIDTSAVKELPASETLSTTWYDLQGRVVKNPSNGVYLRVDKKADGTRRASKVVK